MIDYKHYFRDLDLYYKLLDSLTLDEIRQLQEIVEEIQDDVFKSEQDYIDDYSYNVGYNAGYEEGYEEAETYADKKLNAEI